MTEMERIIAALRRCGWTIKMDGGNSPRTRGLSAHKGDWWLSVSSQESGKRLGGFITPDWSSARLSYDGEYPSEYHWHACGSFGTRAGLEELLAAIEAVR